MKKTSQQKKRGGRIFSTIDSLAARNRFTKPLLTFRGHALRDFHAWHRRFFKTVKECLRPFPQAVPLRVQVLEKKVFPAYIREKIVFDSEKFMSIPAWVCSPKNETSPKAGSPAKKKSGEKFPGVLCCHGHGIGKNPLVGLDNKGSELLEYHKLISVRLAEQGYVTITPDWRIFGERAEPPERTGAPRDICNLASIGVELFGFTLLGLDVWDGMRCIDYLRTRKDVIPDKIGCVGLSFGGTMTTYISAMDKRISASVISGYLSSNATSLFSGNCWNTCGSQYLPGLLKYGDARDVAGLICPRPLLVQIGQYDSVFSARDALAAFRYVKKIYEAAGAQERLELDLFDGVHELNIPAIVKFFDKWLNPA